MAIASAVAQREFPIAKCEEHAGGLATPAKAIEEACQSDLGLTAGQCEFFSEAWGLAITHAGYSSVDFCRNVGGALKCSQMMDTVLTSPAVKDLAFAECVRKQGAAAVEYCQQFQTSIEVADHSTDLDTLRACYLLEEDVKTVAAPIVAPGNASGMAAAGQGGPTPPEPLMVNASAAKPFGVRVSEGTVPAEPPRITVEPMHGVRRNGSAYEDHHILQGDGPLSSAGVGTPAKEDLPAVPPPTREELAVGAATEAGAMAGATAGAAVGEAAGKAAGHAAGEEVGLDIAANKTVPREAVESAAYKAGFDAGKKAGSKVTSALVRLHATSKPAERVVKAIKAAAEKAPEKASVKTEAKATEAKAGVKAPEAKATAKAAKVEAKSGKAESKKVVKTKTAEKKGEKEKGEKEEVTKIAPYAGFLTKFYSAS